MPPLNKPTFLLPISFTPLVFKDNVYGLSYLQFIIRAPRTECLAFSTPLLFRRVVSYPPVSLLLTMFNLFLDTDDQCYRNFSYCYLSFY